MQKCWRIQVRKTKNAFIHSNTFFKTFELWVENQKKASGHFAGILANISTHNLIILILKKEFTSHFDDFL